MYRPFLLRLLAIVFFSCVGLIALANTVGAHLYTDELVITRCADHGNDIFVLDVNRAITHNLTQTRGRDESYPRWSPEGDRIAFVTDAGEGVQNLLIVTSSGRDVGFFTLNEYKTLDWTPDGERLTLEIYENSTGNLTNLYLLPLNGGQRSQLTDVDTINTSPAWSLDGRWLAYASYRTGSYEIYIRPAGGGADRRITEHFNNNMFPDWSPDGQTIAFASDRSGLWHVYTMTPTGNNIQRLTSGLFPVWSPDGEHIAYSNQRDLYIMDADGQNQRFIMEGGCYADWRP